jgi:transglutaminase-like putative cysteine protease
MVELPSAKKMSKRGGLRSKLPPETGGTGRLICLKHVWRIDRNPASLSPLLKFMKKGNWFAVRAFVLAAVALAVCSARGDTNRYSGGEWSLVDAKPVMAAAAEITPAKYSDCDSATVDQKSVRVYRADGAGECQDEIFTKVLTEKGRRDNRTLAEYFMLPYTTAEVTSLEIIKPDGMVVPVDVAANSKESIDDSQMAENIYDPNMRVLQVNIPSLDIGDVIHSVARQTIERPFIAGEYAEENIFEGEGFIRHITYEVHAPADRPLHRIGLRDEVPGTVACSTQPDASGTITYRWEVNNVPRMFPETSMPPAQMVLQRLFVSTTPDWEAISKWYWNLSQPHLDAVTPEMKQKVRELTAGAATDMDKVKALFYFVSNQIHYMGITLETDRPGFEPHDVCLTFDKKYGVCRDKAALLVALLRTAGLNAYPVIISVGSRKDAQVPDPFFNHAIVGVELEKGRITLMDPTDENTRELLPASDRNQSYLVCRPEGDNIRLSPIEPPEKNMMRIKTTGTLNPDGVIEAESELSFEGVNDDAYRNAFSHMKPDDERRFFEQRLKQAVPGLRLKSLKLVPSDMRDVSTSLRAELEFSVDGMTANGGGKSVASMPWIGKRLGVLNFILDGTGLDKRKYPLMTEVACGVQEDISLKLADGFGGAVSLPAVSSVEDDCVSYRQQFASSSDLLEGSRTLKLKTVEFTPAQYQNLKQTLKLLADDGRKSPILALNEKSAAGGPALSGNPGAPPVESNARILESRKSLDVTDPHTAVYRVKFSKRILTYSGKIRESEVKIPFNPACEQARLVSAVVTSPTGERQEISKNEINVMDAGWNASAKRYTGGKILVASLPGVDVGSTIEVEFEITSTNKPFISGFESFQLPDELEQKSFVLTAPAGMKIQRLVSGAAGAIASRQTNSGDRQEFQWQAEKVAALPAETQLPPDWVFAAGVGYFAGDAADYFKELNKTMLDRSGKSAKAAELARQLTAKAGTRLDAVKSIRDFVAKTIRDAGPSFTELPLSELSDADTTLTDGYGHAADRAILLHSMLEAAGFQPEFVLASGLPAIAGITNVAMTFPLPESFQTPLVRITLDGVNYYLNDTDQYAQPGSTGCDGALGIALSTGAWEIVRAAKDCADATRTDYTLMLDDSGRTLLEVSRRYYGENFNEKNRYFSELPPEERKRYFQEAVSGVAQGAQAVGDLTTAFDSYPGLEQFSVIIENYGIASGNYFYFNLPATPPLMAAGADQRALPMLVSQANKDTVRVAVDLPPDFSRILIEPRSEKFSTGAGTARLATQESPGGCVVTDEFETVPSIVSPAGYQAMLKMESALDRKSSKVFLLEQQ